MKTIKLAADYYQFPVALFVRVDHDNKEEIIESIQEALEDREQLTTDELYTQIFLTLNEHYHATFAAASSDKIFLTIDRDTDTIENEFGMRKPLHEFVKRGFSADKNVVKFRYTKDNGESSIRNVEVVSDEDNYICGLDLDDNNKWKRFSKDKMSLRL